MEDSDKEPSDLIIELDTLQKRINSHGGKMDGDSMAERYRYFVEHSERGKSCVYARKCKDLFLRYDYEDIRDQLLLVLEELRLIEGRDFGAPQPRKEDNE